MVSTRFLLRTSAWLLVGLGTIALSSTATSCGSSDTTPSAPHNQLLSANRCETCAVLEGNVSCWGQLTPSLMPPTPLPQGSTPTKVALPGPATLLSVGPEQVCVSLDQQAGVYCWGLNDVGQLGVPITADDAMKARTAPVKTTFSPSAKTIVGGEGFTCVLDSNGFVKCAGGRIEGTLGNGKGVKSDIPITVPSLGTVSALVGGQRHACTLDVNGVVSCWGSNKLGQCGQMGTDTELFAVIVPIDAADKLWSGTNTVCAHTTKGEHWCWGDNSFGIEGDTMAGTAPRKVSLDKYAQLALGGTRACGVDAQGNVDCWGQEIAAKPMMVLAPTTTSGVLSPNALVTGYSHHCAWAGGVVYCWGQNDCGQTGLLGPIIPAPSNLTL